MTMLWPPLFARLGASYCCKGWSAELLEPARRSRSMSRLIRSRSWPKPLPLWHLFRAPRCRLASIGSGRSMVWRELRLFRASYCGARDIARPWVDLLATEPELPKFNIEDWTTGDITSAMRRLHAA